MMETDVLYDSTLRGVRDSQSQSKLSASLGCEQRSLRFLEPSVVFEKDSFCYLSVLLSSVAVLPQANSE